MLASTLFFAGILAAQNPTPPVRSAKKQLDFKANSARKHGKDTLPERPSHFNLAFSQDNAFGFVPQVFASFPFKKMVWDYTFYANFWTNPAQANTTRSSDFWVESGVGLGRHLGKNEQWYINPTLGFSSGRMLSGSDRGLFAEGIVPSLTIHYMGNRLEGEIALNFYKAVRGVTKKNPGTDYLRFWASGGVIFTRFVSVGWLYENYGATANPVQTYYSWLGAYMKVTIKDKYWLKFSTGINTESNEFFGPEFYRLSAGIPLAD